ncbi:MAG: PLP-dependent lyase/thiolase [Candidatus ainarchaeum sp.]|nr:PLP-dependent lyase/thiolase [Candidatus ainarchaeum sp.]
MSDSKRTMLRTPMFKSIEMCGRCNGANVFVKREDKNPFGTFKDRRCAALLEQHSMKNELVFVHITTGNSGCSLGMMAQEEARKTRKSIKVVNIVPKGLPKAIRKRLESCAIVHEMDLSKGIISSDEMRAIARKLTGYAGPDENLVSVESYGLANGYKNIPQEIADDGVKPKYIFVPVGEGELITEVTKGAEGVWCTPIPDDLSGEELEEALLLRERELKELPKIIGVTIPQNAIVQDKNFLKKPGKSLADKLINGYSKFKGLVLDLVKRDRIELMTVSESGIAKEYKWLNSIGIAVEPSAAVAFCGAEKYDLKPEDTVVIINTGKGVYDQSAVEKRWIRRLVKGLKITAITLCTSLVLGVGALSGYSLFLSQQNKIYDSLYYKAKLYADKDGDHDVSIKEAQVACESIPNRKGCDKAVNLQDLSPKELEYYAKTQEELAGAYDNIMADVRRKRTIAFQNGTYECQDLAASICNSNEPTYLIFDSPFDKLKHLVINNEFLYTHCKWLLKLP